MKIPAKGLISSVKNLLFGSAFIILPSAGIGWLITQFMNALVNSVSNEVFAGFTWILSAFIFVVAVVLHKGKEDTLAVLPVLMTTVGLTLIVSTVAPIVSFAADLTTIHGVALAIAEILLALAFVESIPGINKFVKFGDLTKQK